MVKLVEEQELAAIKIRLPIRAAKIKAHQLAEEDRAPDAVLTTTLTTIEVYSAWKLKVGNFEDLCWRKNLINKNVERKTHNQAECEHPIS